MPGDGGVASPTPRERMIRYLMIGGIIIIGMFVMYVLLIRKPKANTAATNTSSSTDAAIASGGTGTTNAVPYVATSDSVTTETIYNQSNNTNSPVTTATTTGDSSPVSAPVTTGGPTTTTTNGPVTTINPPPVSIPPPPPVPAPTPPPTPAPPVQQNPSGPPPPPASAGKRYVIVWGDTLSGIAARYGTTWQNIYNANKATIDATSAQHGNPIKGGPWNDIFPGETIYIP